MGRTYERSGDYSIWLYQGMSHPTEKWHHPETRDLMNLNGGITPW